MVAELSAHQLSHTHTTRASSPIATAGKGAEAALQSSRQDHPHLCQQTQLYCAAQLRYRAFSPWAQLSCMHAASREGWGWGFFTILIKLSLPWSPQPFSTKSIFNHLSLVIIDSFCLLVCHYLAISTSWFQLSHVNPTHLFIMLLALLNTGLSKAQSISFWANKILF